MVSFESMREARAIKPRHIVIIAATGIAGGLLGFMAAGWGAMIGAGVSGALGGCIACLTLGRRL